MIKTPLCFSVLSKVAQSTSENNLAYTSNDRISSLTHDTGAYAFTYDGYQQISNVKYNNTTLLTKTYTLTNDKDTVLTEYDNNGKMRCVSDKYGNPLSVTDTQNNKTLLSYVYGSIKDDVENVTERACENKSEILRKKCHQNIDNPFNVVYNYDILKRLSSIVRNDGVTIEYDYDEQNRLFYEGVHDTRWINYCYSYNDGDAHTSEKVSTIVADTDIGELSTAYKYDKFERLTEKNIEFNVAAYGDNYIDYLYEYESNTIDGEACTSERVNKITTCVARNNRDYQDYVTYTQTLTYDNNGNIQTISSGANDSVTYTYDDRNRLTQEENTALNRKYVFTYNDGGNITSKKEYNKSTGALLHTYSYSYSNDRLTNFDGTAITYDACGNPLSYKGNTLTWTRGRLLSQYGGVSFQYDGEGFRRTKVNGTDTVTYYYQDGKLLSEKHSDTSKNLYFIHHGNEIVGFLTENVDLYYYQKDVLGNVIAIYNPEGEKVASYTYDAWGNCTIGTNVDGLADLNPIRYRGYYYDTEANLYYLQTRYYDPQTGRFISPDTVEYLDPETIHGLNLYAYGLNNPVMYVDPTGHFVLSVFLTCLIAGAVIGAVAGGVTAAQNDSDILTGVLTGALLGGAVGAVAGAGGAYLMGGLSSIAGKLISDSVSSLVSGTNSFGGWEDYAVAFVFGGLMKGANISGSANKIMDIAIRPLLNQTVKMGVKGGDFRFEKYIGDVVCRGLTSNIQFGKISFFGEKGGLLKPSTPSIEINLGKYIARGFTSGMRKRITWLW